MTDAARRLREAAELGDLGAVLQELAYGVDINDRGETNWTALHRAVERERFQIVQVAAY